MPYVYETEGVCATTITVELDGDVIKRVEFENGCDGNLKAISRVVQGMTVGDVERYFSGITCDDRNTSCSAQLAIAVRRAFEEAQNPEGDAKSPS